MIYAIVRNMLNVLQFIWNERLMLLIASLVLLQAYSVLKVEVTFKPLTRRPRRPRRPRRKAPWLQVLRRY